MRVVVMILFVVLLYPAIAVAQDDVMEAQRCIFRCLAASKGADDPAYGKCVAQKCNDSPDEAAPSQNGYSPSKARWHRATRMRYPAYMECASKNMCLLLSCPERAGIKLELYAVENSRKPGDSITMRIDRKDFQFVLPPRTDGDLYRWDLAPDMARALGRGLDVKVIIDPGGRGTDISLRGSAAALDRLATMCR